MKKTKSNIEGVEVERMDIGKFRLMRYVFVTALVPVFLWSIAIIMVGLWKLIHGVASAASVLALILGICVAFGSALCMMALMEPQRLTDANE